MMTIPVRARRRRGRLLLALTAVVAVIALPVLPATPAAAHANLVDSTPMQGEQLDEGSVAVSFTMDEPVQLVEGSVRLIDAGNRLVPLGEPQVSEDRTIIEAEVEEPLEEGAYLASMRAVSLDSHVVAYSIQFTVGDAELSGLAELGAGEYGQAGGGWTTVIQVARVMGYAGAVLSFGLLIALGTSGRGAPAPIGASQAPGGLRIDDRALAVSGIDGQVAEGAEPDDASPLTPERVSGAAPRARSRLIAAALTGVGLMIAGAALNLLAHGPYSQGAEDWTALLRFEGLRATLSSAVGVLLLVRLAAAALLAVWIRWGGPPWRASGPLRAVAVPLLTGTVIAYTFAAGGHAAVGADAVLAIVSTAVHVLAMAVWMGGIAALLLGGRTPVLRESWTRLALLCLLAVLATGLYQSARRVYPLESLWDTAYGLLLIGKAAGVLGIVLAAFWARRWLRDRGGGSLPVRTEAALGAGVLLLTTVLASSVPARDDYGPPLAVSAQLEHGSLDVHADTTRRGPVTVSLEPDATAREGIEGISASLSSEAAGIARLPVDLDEEAGVWTSDNVIVPAPGEWTLSIVVDDGISPVVTAVRYVVW